MSDLRSNYSFKEQHYKNIIHQRAVKPTPCHLCYCALELNEAYSSISVLVSN